MFYHHELFNPSIVMVCYYRSGFLICENVFDCFMPWTDVARRPSSESYPSTYFSELYMLKLCMFPVSSTVNIAPNKPRQWWWYTQAALTVGKCLLFLYCPYASARIVLSLPSLKFWYLCRHLLAVKSPWSFLDMGPFVILLCLTVPSPWQYHRTQQKTQFWLVGKALRLWR
jgi:hypothetical protein